MSSLIKSLLLPVVACSVAALPATLNAAATAEPAPVRAVIEAGQTGTPISPFVYGQFVEHIHDLVNDTLWAEMLDDRKFYHPVLAAEPPPPETPARFGRTPQRRWLAVGPITAVTMDRQAPWVGEHSPRVALAGDEPRGISQAGLALRAGRRYTGRVVLAAEGTSAAEVTLIWGADASNRQTQKIAALTPAFSTHEFAFTAGADHTDARIEITATGRGSLRIGAVSLMPADNIEGFRRDVVTALKSLHSGVYRFPGGNFVSAHEWRDAVGPRDRRAPTMDPVRPFAQPNDVGTDEFLTLCRLLEVEPYITVSAGFGDAWSAAQLVEYCNGPVTTPMGRSRAENGHPEPYHVKYWGIGNEPWGDWQFGAMAMEQFLVKHNLFAKAMRRVDPNIILIAGGAMPDTMTCSKQTLRITGKIKTELLGPADWTGGFLQKCFENTDMIAEHFYAYTNRRFDVEKGDSVPLDPDEPLIEWMRRPANHARVKVEAYREYQELIPAFKAKPIPINLDEWAYAGGSPGSYKTVPALAWVFHEMFRNSDIYQMAAYTFATSLVSTNRTDAVLNPAGLMFKLYRDHFGTIPVAVTGDAPPPPAKYPAGGQDPKVNAGSPTHPLDVVAAWTGDRSALTIAVLNPNEIAHRLNWTVRDAQLAGTGKLWRMAPSDINATILVGEKPGVVVEEQTLNTVPDTVELPPFSISLYVLPAKAR
ncbi:alpha-N-arabinofuranosidase [Opitutus terrae]|uniref:non-reducing end alpha-L-arabinofuranosidase n=1 Tax=Opitutus terrae (strain DSM 11246 / JCM 15787 / PB90-1) TaxID=452637 RepID=B1ZN36_OPITP|nr:alpha-N-arabinofuranosidase [Opitutus terrae]ACB76488.1 Alpha-N-arabinofuranosidase [Opitutus terrae PB90-1]